MLFTIDAATAVPLNSRVEFDRDLAAAEAALAHTVEDGVTTLLKGKQGQRLLIDASMGLGKSWVAMRALARQLRPGQVVWVASPTLALAEQAAATFAEACRTLGRRGLAHLVLRGRGAPDPTAAHRTMCVRAALAERLTGLSASVGELLCRPRQGPPCPHAGGCAYLAQQVKLSTLARHGGVLFVSHAHLFVQHALPAPDAVIIDESPLLTAIERGGLPLETLAYARDEAPDGPLRRVLAKLVEVHAPDRVLARLQAGCMNAAPFARDLASAIETAEALVLQAMPPLQQTSDDEAVAARLEGRVSAEIGDWQQIVRLLRQVAIELPRQRPDFNGIVFRAREPLRLKALATRLDYVEVSSVKPLAIAAGTPVLALDGTACVTLWRLLMGEPLAYYRLRVTREARVIQISGKSFSTRSLIGDRTGALTAHWAAEAQALRRQLVELLNQMTGAVFVSGCKRVIETLAAEGLPAHVACAHYNGQRGSNRWAHCATAVVLGRLEPPPHEIEALGRAYAALTDDPFVAAEAYEQRHQPVTLRDGRVEYETVPAHPDPYAHAVLQLIRETELEQSIDRVRAVRHPRRILLLTNVPVEIEVDERLSWPALRRREASYGMLFDRHGLLPLRPDHLLGLAPAAWPSEAAAGKTTQRMLSSAKTDKAQIESLLGTCRFSPATAVIRYRVGSKSRYSTLLVDLKRHPDPRAALAELLADHGLLSEGQEVTIESADARS